MNEMPDDFVAKFVRPLTENIAASRPDRLKADYERVMAEAGLLDLPPKVWVSEVQVWAPEVGK